MARAYQNKYRKSIAGQNPIVLIVGFLGFVPSAGLMLAGIILINVTDVGGRLKGVNDD